MTVFCRTWPSSSYKMLIQMHRDDVVECASPPPDSKNHNVSNASQQASRPHACTWGRRRPLSLAASPRSRGCPWSGLRAHSRAYVDKPVGGASLHSQQHLAKPTPRAVSLCRADDGSSSVSHAACPGSHSRRWTEEGGYGNNKPRLQGVGKAEEAAWPESVTRREEHAQKSYQPKTYRDLAVGGFGDSCSVFPSVKWGCQ